MKRRLTETMCGVPVSSATRASPSTSASEAPSGFSMTHGTPRRKSLAPPSAMRSTGMTVTHASTASLDRSSSTSAYARANPNRSQNSNARGSLRSHAAASETEPGRSAAYLARGAAWLPSECSPQPTSAMLIISRNSPARASGGRAFARRLVLFARDPDGARPQLADHAQQHEPARGEDDEQREGVGRAPVEEVAHGEERRPDHRAARDPPEERHRDVVGALDRLLGDARLAPYRAPARPRRVNLTVEGHERLAV